MPAKEPLHEIAARVETAQGLQLSQQTNIIKRLEARLEAAEVGRALAEQTIKELSGGNANILKSAHRLTVFEVTEEKVYLAAEVAPAITHFVLERRLFESDAEVQQGMVLSVTISAAVASVPPPPPQAEEQESLRQELGALARELDEHRISGPVTL